MLFLRFLLFLWVVDLLYHVSIFPAPNVLALNFPIHNIFFFCYFTLHDFRAFHSPTSISFGNHYSPCSSFPFNFFVVLLCFFGCKRAPNELHTVKIAQENQRCQSVLTNLTYRRDRKCMCVWCRRALENSKANNKKAHCRRYRHRRTHLLFLCFLSIRLIILLVRILFHLLLLFAFLLYFCCCWNMCSVVWCRVAICVRF